MTTQKHLNCEGESCSLVAEQCAPHIFLTCLKFVTCHKWVLPTVRGMVTEHQYLMATWSQSSLATFLDIRLERFGSTDMSRIASCGMTKWNRNLE